MQYISPFHSLGLDTIGQIDKSSLNLAKKKMLAELELSTSGTLLRGSKELTKNDVIKTFDNLANVSDWDAHRHIAEDSTLLNFLENRTLQEDSFFLKTDIYQDESFIEFVSPYFSNSYGHVLFNCLKKNDYTIISKLINHTPKLMTEWDQQECESLAVEWINSRIEILEEISYQVKKGTRFREKEVSHLYETDFISCLNILTDDFQWLRDKYIMTLYNYSAYLWNNYQRKKAKNIIDIAGRFKCSSYERGLLQERIQFFDNSELSNWLSIYWRMFYMVFFEKPLGVTLAISWIFKIIAAPVILPYLGWARLYNYIEEYSVGRAILSIGNLGLYLFGILYSIWLVSFPLGFIITSIADSDSKTLKFDNKIFQGVPFEHQLYEDMPLTIGNIQDSIKKYENLLRNFDLDDKSIAVKWQLTLDTLKERKQLYEVTYSDFKDLRETLAAKNKLAQTDSTIKFRIETDKDMLILADSFDLYKLHMERIVQLNASWQNASAINQARRIKMKDNKLQAQVDSILAKQFLKRSEIIKDSIRIYDRILQNLKKQNIKK
jgi:hypothetical protein